MSNQRQFLTKCQLQTEKAQKKEEEKEEGKEEEKEEGKEEEKEEDEKATCFRFDQTVDLGEALSVAAALLRVVFVFPFFIDPFLPLSGAP